MRPEELLTANIALVERAIAFACRRYQLSPDDAEELASIVKLRLVENDYAILRAYEGRSSLCTYVSIVVQRMALDYRVSLWGKFHISAEAKRLGAVAIDLERLLQRDGRTFDEAVAILCATHPDVTRESLDAIAKKLPARTPRARGVALDDAAPVAVTGSEGVEAHVLAEERQRTAARVSELLSKSLGKLTDDDQLILQLRFQDGMTVAQIARALRLDQKELYRRIERCMRGIRREMEGSGVEPAEVLDLIGRDDAVLDFSMGKRSAHPSMGADGTAASHPEGLQ